MAYPLTPSRISKRVVAALAALALAIAAPVAIAASSSGSSVVHAYVDRSGSTVVSGYDGGVALAPSTAAP